MAKKRHSRDVSANERLNAVQRIEAGESKASVSRNINVPESTLRGWCKNYTKLQLKLSENNDSSFATNKPTEKQIEHNVAQNFVTNKRPKHDYHSSKSRDVIDFTNTDKPIPASLQGPIQSYDVTQSKGWVSPPDMNLTQFKNLSNLHSLQGLNNFQNKGLYSPYVDTVFNYPRDAKFFYPNNQPIAGSQKSYTSIPSPVSTSSPVLTSLASHGSSPSLPMPSISLTAQAISPTTPALNDAKSEILLWQAHNFNQSLIERMSEKSPTNFNNNNIYMPEDLSVRRRPVIQPIKTEVEQEHAVNLSIASKNEPSEIINKRQDALKNTVTNINNNVVEQDSDAGMTGLLDAIQNAEKFSKWFDNYSDPTITTQDVLRFEKLLGKVRKIVERKSNPSVQKLKVHRRK